MHIYCINMADARDRREHTISECGKYGLEVEFIEAVNGKALADDELRELVFEPAREVLTRGEIGCALSHLKAYEKLVRDGFDKALILEDDVVMVSDPRPFIEAAENASAERPDVFLVTSFKIYLAGRGMRLGDIDFYPAIAANCAHAYVITRQAAQNLLAALRPVRILADYWKYFVLCGLINVWVCKDDPIQQHGEDFPSLLENERLSSQPTARRKKYMKRVRAMAPLKNKTTHLLWKIFVKPFVKIAYEDIPPIFAPRPPES